MTDNATAAWRDSDRRHHLHPFTDHAALAEQGVRVITRADGVYLWDSGEQGARIGMLGSAKNFILGAPFHNPPQVHHGDLIR